MPRYELIDLTAIPTDGVETHNEILEYPTRDDAIQDVIARNTAVWSETMGRPPINGVDFELRVVDDD